MKLEAYTRLRSHEVEAITYDMYAKVIASLDTNTLVAFGIPLPNVLKGLKHDLEKVVEHLKGIGVGISDVISAFQERSIFKLLKSVGFAVGKLLKSISAVAGLPGQALFHAMGDLAEAFKDSKFMHALKPAERLAKFEELLKSHPVLAKVSGAVVAGLLILMFIKSSFTGNVDRDLSLVDAVIAALHGNFSLVDMFTSQDGLYGLAVLLFGVATGGSSLVDYGASALLELAKFVDSNAYSLLLALFYAAAKKLKKHYSGAPHQLQARRTQEWLDKLKHEDRHKYLSKYPGSKFKDKTKLIHPDPIQAAERICADGFTEQLKQLAEESGLTSVHTQARINEYGRMVVVVYKPDAQGSLAAIQQFGNVVAKHFLGYTVSVTHRGEAIVKKQST